MEDVEVKLEDRVVQGDERLVAGAEAREKFTEGVEDGDDTQAPAKACEADTEETRDENEKTLTVRPNSAAPLDDEPDGENADEKTLTERPDSTAAPSDKEADGDDADENKSDQNVQGEMEQDKSQEDEDEDKPAGDQPQDEEHRTKLFQEGLQYDKDGNQTEALKCYLKCLVGLKEDSHFALLPQCLRNIGDVYFSRDEYEKAISFIQAEKLYYESVLIDDTELQRHIDEAGGETSAKEENMDALRATEYEQLARLCMDEKKPLYYRPHLALEYAGKATKLRQKVFGDGHPVVQQTLDFFATVYAEVGKVQYTESMTKYDPSERPDLSGDTAGSGDSTPPSPTTEPTSILRKRKSTGEDQRSRRVRFDESQLPPDENEVREERCARVVLLLLFFTLLLVLLILGVYISCSLTQSTGCRNTRRLIYDAVMRLRYLYYHYTTTARDVHYA